MESRDVPQTGRESLHPWSSSPPDQSTTTTDTFHRFPIRCAALAAMAVVSIASCDAPIENPLDACVPGAPCQEGPLLVVADLQFIAETEPGVSRGFDLDGIDGPAEFDCNYKDFTSPDGRTGIDNQIARILPVLSSVVGDAFPSLIRNSINEGGLLMMAEVIDHPTESGKAHLVVHRAEGVPLLDTTGMLLEAQSYQLSVEDPLAVCDAQWKDGVLTGTDCDLRLATVVFGHTYNVTLRDSQFEMILSDDGRSGTMLLGGSIAMPDLMGIVDVIYEIGDVPELAELVATVLPPYADMIGPDTGECDRITATVELTFRSGYALPLTD